MSKIFSQLNKEAKAQQDALAEHKPKPDVAHKDVTPKHQSTTSEHHSDAPRRSTTPEHHTKSVATKRNAKSSKNVTIGIDRQKLTTIVSELSDRTVLPSRTAVRFSDAELKALDDFILINLRNAGIAGPSVSKSKLARYFTYYMIKVGGAEVIEAIADALQKEEKLTI